MSRVPIRVLSLSCLLPALFWGCKKDEPEQDQPSKAESKQTDEPSKAGEPTKESTPAPTWEWELPTGLTDPPLVPEDNPMSARKVELGHKLFMDKRLSVDGSRSCYSCHQNHLGNADGRARALGPGQKELPRNTPTIWNVGLQPALYWDGRAPTLEAQAIGALEGGNMGLGEQLEAKARGIGEAYREDFEEAFGLPAGAAVDSQLVAKALSAYERTLLCGDTKWDRQELSEAAQRGQRLFMGKAACITCHQGPNLSDGLFHVTGVAIDPDGANRGDPATADPGRFKVSEEAKDKHAFRTPTLRNVARTAPYFHDGSVQTLEEAVRIMAAGGKPGDHLVVDQLLLDRKLTDDEINDLVAFFEHLSCPGALEEIGDQSAEGIAPAPT